MWDSVALSASTSPLALHISFIFGPFTSLWADIGADAVDDTPARISPTHLAPPPKLQPNTFHYSHMESPSSVCYDSVIMLDE